MTEREGRWRSAGLVSRAWHAFDGLAVDTLWSGVHDVAQLVAAVTSFVLLQQVLALEEYGAYFGLYGLIGTFGAMSYSGIGLALLQRIMGERDDPDRSLRAFLQLAAIVGLVAATLAIGFAFAFLQLTTVEIIVIVVAELLSMGIVWIAVVSVQASSGFPAAVRVRLGVIAIRFATLLTLYYAGSLSIRNLGTGFLIGFTCYAVFLLAVHLPRHGYRVGFGPLSGRAARSSALFAIPMGAAKLQTDADKFLLNAFRFAADAGLYGAAYRVVQLGTLPLAALDAAAFQRFLPRGDGQRGLHWRRAVRLGGLMFVASVFVALALYLALPLLDVLFEERYKDAIDIVPWLLVLIPLIATSSTPTNGLLGLGRADKRMLVYLSSAAVSLISYLILIPRYSWKGAVLATFVSEVYLAVAGWTALRYYQRIADRDLDGAGSDPAAGPDAVSTLSSGDTRPA